jgi:hypothetical protein
MWPVVFAVPSRTGCRSTASTRYQRQVALLVTALLRLRGLQLVDGVQNLLLLEARRFVRVALADLDLLPGTVDRRDEARA